MKKTVLGSALLIGATLVACQGRTIDNVEPTGDTVEVNPYHPVERADTVLHSMDDEMLHALDNATVIETKI